MENAATAMTYAPATKTPAYLWVIALAGIVLAPGAFGYLATTFLFAFSGGQYRMIAVVNVVALVVVALGAVVAALAWRLRSAAAAVILTAIVTGAGWVAAVIGEWLLSFRLGAGRRSVRG